MSSKPTIAWIEDDSAIIESVMEPMREAGYKIVQLRSVSEVLARIEDLRDASLILLDIFLPDGDEEDYPDRYVGIHLLKDLRENHAIELPVIVFSVLDPLDWRDELQSNQGVVKFLRKPVLPTDLKDAVDEVLGLSRG